MCHIDTLIDVLRQALSAVLTHCLIRIPFIVRTLQLAQRMIESYWHVICVITEMRIDGDAAAIGAA
jgi:hypothetical protein